ncbi:MAG TPA: hypothetical protein PLQ57_06940 [Saprospiraceae bacterium]|nr:hypothetical protein [Saprospiraceae bacterium]HRG20747.1 hypothetical protein [Saprospiraceae bacterium]HRG64209.1 hypothetical protein [Saprospiraceae bacterium]
MNKILIILVATFSMMLAAWFLADQYKASPTQMKANAKRVSVTFILGTDEKSKNSFYSNASYFFNMNEQYKTNYVVNNCSTLIEVLDYLLNQHPGYCYSTINLVGHGNPWQGLRIPIDKGLPRASAVHLKNAFDANLLSPLCSPRVDGGTTINVVSCGVGNNVLFVEMLKKLFFCPDNETQPTLHCEKFYVNFSNNREYVKSSLFYIVSKYDQHNTATYVSKLKNKYPSNNIDWEAAYSNTCNRELGLPYRYHFKMLVDWKVSLDPQETKPVLNSDASIIAWLKNQDFALYELSQMQMNAEDIHWHCLSDPATPHLVKIKGYCNIEGVMVDHKLNEEPSSMAAL